MHKRLPSPIVCSLGLPVAANAYVLVKCWKVSEITFTLSFMDCSMTQSYQPILENMAL